MNKSDLIRIEAALGMSVPKDYRELMLARTEELQEVAHTFPSFTETLFLEADQVIRCNLAEREADMGTADASPRWWTDSFSSEPTAGATTFASASLETGMSG